MTTAKRKVSGCLDADLVAEIEAGDGTLSGAVNEAVRSEFARRRRHRLLGEMLDAMEQVDGPPDEAEVQRYMELLQ